MEARCYPSQSVCKRAVHALCALAGNDFTAADVWYDGRCMSRRRGCCLVAQLPGDIPGSKPRYSDQFYFGRDSEGYILVNDRANIDDWPRTCDGGERTLPIRLTRWITQASPHAVVRHACDEPACIRKAHLHAGTHRENLSDAYARGRRHRTSTVARPARAQRAAPSPSASTCFELNDRDREFPLAQFYSPSKKARKIAKSAR